MNLTIDNRKITTGKAVTVLDAARQNGIHIPSLCAHPELTPYGGCRLCVVEIEGRNGFPTSCTTLVEEGMVVRTQTKGLQEMRQEVIQLILSEHPAACLMCEDIEGCELFQGTIRKVGITTGCRWCPKDKDCELQRIVTEFGIQELTLPGLYRDLPLEKYDPFFDRDYNLCIYCGRCVRICYEHRRSSVLSLKQRGKLTTIGPAFDATHIDADCEFCGACVSVCPTGAMSEKSRKWWGLPEHYAPSVCPLCSLNCDLQVLTTKDRIVGTLPPGIPHESGGSLCVKGRFCLSELVNRTERMLEPQYRYPEGYGIVSWDFALEKTREMVGTTSPGRSALFISPSLTLEEIYAARMFGENVLRTREISASCLDDNFISYIELARESVSLDKLQTSGAILAFFLNGNYNFAPLTLAIKSAADQGVPYYQVGWTTDTTSRFARRRFSPVGGKENELLDQLISCLKKGSCEEPAVRELAGTLQKSKRNIFLIGPQLLSLSNCYRLLGKIKRLAEMTKAVFFIPNAYGNLFGLLSLVDLKRMDSITKKIEEGRIDLLYLVGDIPYSDRPGVKNVVYQGAFPPPPGLLPDVMLPSSVWGENGGSYMGTAGSLKKHKSLAATHGYARSHGSILQGAAGDKKKFKAKLMTKEMKQLLQNPVRLPKQSARPVQAGTNQTARPGKKYSFLLLQEKSPHLYSGLDLGRDIAAFTELVHPGKVLINPYDADKLGIHNGDPVYLKAPGKKTNAQVVLRKNIPRGILYMTLAHGKPEFENNPCYVTIQQDHG